MSDAVRFNSIFRIHYKRYTREKQDENLKKNLKNPLIPE